MARLVTRRALLRSAGVAAPALLLSGCDWLGGSPSFRDIVLHSGEWLSYRVHRLIGSEALAREFDPSEMSPVFRTNGNTQPPVGGLSPPRRDRISRIGGSKSGVWSRRRAAIN